MAMVNFKKGLFANLPATKVEGAFYVTTDERAIYLDIDGNTRIRIGDFQEFATLDALKANTNPSTTALYYIADVNCLAKWNGTAYVQINLDTGATSIEVVGSGNAVTSASYNAATRKLTLTMGETFATAADVTAKIGDVGDKTVKQYVDDATDGIASDAALTAMGERVTAVEGGVNTLVGSDVNKSVRTIANEELAAQLIPESAKESLDTLAEIAAWIQAHPDDASAMNKAIDDLKALVGTLPADATATTVVGYIKEYADAAVAALKIGDYAKAADLSAAVARITSLETDSHTHDNKVVLDSITADKVSAWDGAEQNAKSYTDTALTWGSF